MSDELNDSVCDVSDSVRDSVRDSDTDSDSVSDDLRNEQEKLSKLTEVIESFRQRSEILEQAYNQMTDQFSKLNIELDEKNRKLEESLQEQDRLRTVLESILETMHNGVIAVDTHGRVTQFNRASEEISGYERSSVLGQSIDHSFGEKGFTDTSLMEVLYSGTGHERDEKVLWHRSGEPVPVVYQSSLLKDHSGVLLGAVEIFSDISKLKELELENQQNRTLAALGEMAATLAHEIKNPIGAMGTWARLLDRTISVDDKRKKTLGKIIDALSRLNKIVSSMLIFGRQSHSATLRQINIKEMLHEFTDSMEVEVVFVSGKSIEVVKEWDDQSLIVSIDPEKIRQVLLNLVINAVQAMGEEGRLVVSCNAPAQDAEYVQISVSDTGGGIAESELETIFTPFHTTKENGTGLGLAIVKKLVDFHNGAISVKSRLNQGTTFDIFLPLADQ